MIGISLYINPKVDFLLHGGDHCVCLCICIISLSVGRQVRVPKIYAVIKENVSLMKTSFLLLLFQLCHEMQSCLPIINQVTFEACKCVISLWPERHSLSCFLMEEQIKLIPDIAMKILTPGMGNNTCVLRSIVVSLFQQLMLG